MDRQGRKRGGVIKIRPIAEDDDADWRQLWSGYLTFYNTELPQVVTDNLFQNLVRGEPHFALVAEHEGRVIGFAHCLPHASTWSSAPYCYLEDLYVDAEVRGTGAGRALVETVYEEADRRGYSRVYWHTEESNVTARRLYDRLATLSEFVQYRRS